MTRTILFSCLGILVLSVVIQGFMLDEGQCGCPDGWVTFGESCYLFGHQQGMHFTEAEHYCEQHNSQLVVVTSYQENVFLKDYLARLQTANYWLGLTDEMIEGQWNWQGSDEPVNFTDWTPGQPDSWHAHNEDCGLFYHPHKFLWDDGPCDVNNQPLCEKEIAYPDSGALVG